MTRKILPWKKLESKQIADCRVFSVSRQTSRASHKSERSHDFYVLHGSNWVNVIPLTAEHQVVLIEQFRHGIEEVTLEIPGGGIDENDENAEAAAARELLEETGFVAERFIRLGNNHPNPAIQSNICETFLALNVRQIQQPIFEGTEDIALRLVPLDSVPELVKSGQITHALVMVAFYLLNLYEQENGLH